MTAETAIVLMTADEAKLSVATFRDVIRSAEYYTERARTLALDLYEREGWRALGYESWRACATAELGLSKSHVYRLLTAAEIEREIAPALMDFSHDGKNPELTEAALRPLAQLDTPEARQAAARAAMETADGKAPTAAQMQQAVAEQSAPRGRLCEHCHAPATERRNLRGMLAWRCSTCAAEQERLQDEEVADSAYDYDMAALNAALDRAESLGAIYDPMQQRADGRMPVLSPPGFGGEPKQPAYYDAAELQRTCDLWEAWQRRGADEATPAPSAWQETQDGASPQQRPLPASEEATDAWAPGDARTRARTIIRRTINVLPAPIVRLLLAALAQTADDRRGILTAHRSLLDASVTGLIIGAGARHDTSGVLLAQILTPGTPGGTDVAAALDLARALAPDDLATIADQLSDAQYEALATLCRPVEAI